MLARWIGTAREPSLAAGGAQTLENQIGTQPPSDALPRLLSGHSYYGGLRDRGDRGSDGKGRLRHRRGPFRGDVARLTEPKLGGPFDLVYDSKCFHSLPAESHGEMSRAWLNFRGDRMNLWTGC